MKSRLRSEGGFTLIEVILTVVILAIITVPIGNLMIEYLTDTTDVGARVDASIDAQMAGQYFGQDIAAMGARGTSTTGLPKSLWVRPPAGSAASDCGQNSGTVVLLTA